MLKTSELMVSFDVISLFTAKPVQKACDYIKEKLEQDSSLSQRTHLKIDDIVSLLNFVVSNNYLVFEGQTYKQIDGCAMGALSARLLRTSAWKRLRKQPSKQLLYPPRP